MADPDGSQICNEIMYLFSKFARFLIDHGMVYRALSPLFRGVSKTTGKVTYYYPDDPIDPSTQFPIDLDTKKHYDRWKGLASLSPETGEVYDLSRLHDVEAIRKLIFDLEFKLNQISNRDEHIIQLLSGE